MIRILVVEDEKDIRELITLTLQFSGFEVVSARDGVEALKIVNNIGYAFDLFLLDVRMPRMTGYQLCRELRVNPLAGSRFVIFLSAKGQEAEVQQGLEAGADQYILKPFAPDALIKTIKEFAPLVELRYTDDPDVRQLITQHDLLDVHSNQLADDLSLLFSIQNNLEGINKVLEEALKRFLTLDFDELKKELQNLVFAQTQFENKLLFFEKKLNSISYGEATAINTLILNFENSADEAIKWFVTGYKGCCRYLDETKAKIPYLKSVKTKYRSRITILKKKLETIPIPDFNEIKRQLAYLSSSKEILENEVQKLKKKLEEAQLPETSIIGSPVNYLAMNDLSRITGGIVHDIRNGLGVIRNTVGFLRDDLTNDTYQQDLIKIATSADFCELVLRNLSALGGQDVFQPQLVDLEAIVQEVYFLLNRKLIDIDLITLVDPETPLIMADEGYMKQVFLNLIKNAGEAMPDGGSITFKTKSYRTSRLKRQMLRVELSDTGTGISNENQKRLFTKELFTTKEEGYGLGLYIVSTIIKRHGGKIRVKSALGKGTTFILYLPVESKG